MALTLNFTFSFHLHNSTEQTELVLREVKLAPAQPMLVSETEIKSIES